ncbi:unnamed protein product [Linum trigynum]|uniref:AIG1-type G domain-containing protein n=1 Tax=Linum trigynum TaxID=586398 RepID=A0AAV2CW00_9ROSI
MDTAMRVSVESRPTTLALVGPRATGKSSLANAILETQAFGMCGGMFSLHRANVLTAQVQNYNLVTVVDTPGNDFVCDRAGVAPLKHILKSLEGVDAILVVLSAAKPHVPVAENIKKMLGEDVSAYLVGLVTGADRHLSGPELENLDRRVQAPEGFEQLWEACNGRVVRFEICDDKELARQQLRRLLDLVSNMKTRHRNVPFLTELDDTPISSARRGREPPVDQSFDVDRLPAILARLNQVAMDMQCQLKIIENHVKKAKGSKVNLASLWKNPISLQKAGVLIIVGAALLYFSVKKNE